MKRPIATCAAALALAAGAALGATGCGGGGSAADPATLAPDSAPLFADVTLRPQGNLKSSVDDLIGTVAGVDDPGAEVAKLIDRALADSDAKGLTFEDDVEPWLGERAGVFFERFDGKRFSGIGGVVQTTDADKAQDFVDKLAAAADGKIGHDDYEGVKFDVGPKGSAVGLVGDFLVVAQDTQTFQDVVDASKDSAESLDADSRYRETSAKAPAGSIADVYANVGALIGQAGTSIDPRLIQLYTGVGLDFLSATALVSVVPESDRVEIDAGTDASGTTISSAGVQKMLGSFPADAFVALAASDVGRQLQQLVAGVDSLGLGELQPNQIEKTVARATGINLGSLFASVEDAGLFVSGTGRADASGALVLTTISPGVAAQTARRAGRAAGRSDLSGKPLVALSRGNRVALGLGAQAAREALSGKSSGPPLSSSSDFNAARKALGAPVTAFVDIPPLLRLAKSSDARDAGDFAKAEPYLKKLRYLAFGILKRNGLTTARTVLGFGD